jgi:hypothetical protein
MTAALKGESALAEGYARAMASGQSRSENEAGTRA